MSGQSDMDVLLRGEEAQFVSSFVAKDELEIISHQMDDRRGLLDEFTWKEDSRDSERVGESSAHEIEEARDTNSIMSNESRERLEKNETHNHILLQGHMVHTSDMMEQGDDGYHHQGQRNENNKKQENFLVENKSKKEDLLQYQGNSMEAIKNLLSKYTDTASTVIQNQNPSVERTLETIEPSHFTRGDLDDDFESMKRPSLNLLNFLPSDEASDPFLHVIEEADEEVDSASIDGWKNSDVLSDKGTRVSFENDYDQIFNALEDTKKDIVLLDQEQQSHDTHNLDRLENDSKQDPSEFPCSEHDAPTDTTDTLAYNNDYDADVGQDEHGNSDSLHDDDYAFTAPFEGNHLSSVASVLEANITAEKYEDSNNHEDFENAANEESNPTFMENVMPKAPSLSRSHNAEMSFNEYETGGPVDKDNDDELASINSDVVDNRHFDDNESVPEEDFESAANEESNPTVMKNVMPKAPSLSRSHDAEMSLNETEMDRPVDKDDDLAWINYDVVDNRRFDDDESVPEEDFESAANEDPNDTVTDHGMTNEGESKVPILNDSRDAEMSLNDKEGEEEGYETDRPVDKDDDLAWINYDVVDNRHFDDNESVPEKDSESAVNEDPNDTVTDHDMTNEGESKVPSLSDSHYAEMSLNDNEDHETDRPVDKDDDLAWINSDVVDNRHFDDNESVPEEDSESAANQDPNDTVTDHDVPNEGESKVPSLSDSHDAEMSLNDKEEEEEEYHETDRPVDKDAEYAWNEALNPNDGILEKDADIVTVSHISDEGNFNVSSHIYLSYEEDKISTNLPMYSAGRPISAKDDIVSSAYLLDGEKYEDDECLEQETFDKTAKKDSHHVDSNEDSCDAIKFEAQSQNLSKNTVMTYGEMKENQDCPIYTDDFLASIKADIAANSYFEDNYESLDETSDVVTGDALVQPHTEQYTTEESGRSHEVAVASHQKKENEMNLPIDRDDFPAFIRADISTSKSLDDDKRNDDELFGEDKMDSQNSTQMGNDISDERLSEETSQIFLHDDIMSTDQNKEDTCFLGHPLGNDDFIASIKADISSSSHLDNNDGLFEDFENPIKEDSHHTVTEYDVSNEREPEATPNSDSLNGVLSNKESDGNEALMDETFDNDDFVASIKADIAANVHLDDGCDELYQEESLQTVDVEDLHKTTENVISDDREDDGKTGLSRQRDVLPSDKQSTSEYDGTPKANNFKRFATIRSIFARPFRRHKQENGVDSESKHTVANDIRNNVSNVIDLPDEIYSLSTEQYSQDNYLSATSDLQLQSRSTTTAHEVERRNSPFEPTTSKVSLTSCHDSATPSDDNTPRDTVTEHGNNHIQDVTLHEDLDNGDELSPTSEHSKPFDSKDVYNVPEETDDNYGHSMFKRFHSNTITQDEQFVRLADSNAIVDTAFDGRISRSASGHGDDCSFCEDEKKESNLSPVMPSSSSLSTISTASQGKNEIEFELFSSDRFVPASVAKSSILDRAMNRTFSGGIPQRSIEKIESAKSTKGSARSVSTPRSSAHASPDQQSVYQRLHSLAKNKKPSQATGIGDKNNVKKNVESIFRSSSVPRMRSKSIDHGVPSYNAADLAVKKRNADMKQKTFLEKISHSSNPERRKATGILSTQERLFNLAKKKREIEEQRRRLKQKEIEEKNKSKGLVLETRSYTPRRTRGENVHLRLYSLSQIKHERKQDTNVTTRHQNSSKGKPPVRSVEECNASVNRLYSRSLKMQEEGLERRKKIEMKHRKGEIPTGKISLERATAIYERGMVQKMALEMKREEEAMLPYVSPLLNPLLAVDDLEDESVFHSVRGRSSSVTRYRSQTPTGSRNTVRATSNSRGRSSRPQSRIGRSDSFSSIPRSTSMKPTEDHKRLRSRSRLRAATPTAFSFRSPSPSLNSSRNVLPRASSSMSVNRYATPQRAAQRNSTKQLLRKMEEDVDFYKKVKKALETKEAKDGGSVSDSSASFSHNHYETNSSHQTSFPPLPRPNSKRLLVNDSVGASIEKFDSQSSSKTCQTGIMTMTSFEWSEKGEGRSSSPVGRYLVRPRSIDYCE